jgi:hypothetical protein
MYVSLWLQPYGESYMQFSVYVPVVLLFLHLYYRLKVESTSIPPRSAAARQLQTPYSQKRRKTTISVLPAFRSLDLHVLVPLSTVQVSKFPEVCQQA